MSYQLGANTIGNLTYMYDSASRVTQMSGSLARTDFPQPVSSATYDIANELTNWNGTTLGYDLNGNLTSDSLSTYIWDARNELASRGGIAYQYDAYGRRVRNAAGNNLLYNGANATQELSGTTPV